MCPFGRPRRLRRVSSVLPASTGIRHTWPESTRIAPETLLPPATNQRKRAKTQQAHRRRFGDGFPKSPCFVQSLQIIAVACMEFVVDLAGSVVMNQAERRHEPRMVLAARMGRPCQLGPSPTTAPTWLAWASPGRPRPHPPVLSSSCAPCLSCRNGPATLACLELGMLYVFSSVSADCCVLPGAPGCTAGHQARFLFPRVSGDSAEDISVDCSRFSPCGHGPGYRALDPTLDYMCSLFQCNSGSVGTRLTQPEYRNCKTRAKTHRDLMIAVST